MTMLLSGQMMTPTVGHHKAADSALAFRPSSARSLRTFIVNLSTSVGPFARIPGLMGVCRNVNRFRSLEFR